MKPNSNFFKMNNSYPIKTANELDDISYSSKIKRNSVSYLIQNKGLESSNSPFIIDLSNVKSENPELSNDFIYNIIV